MKSFLSSKPGATFFLCSSQTLVYHKDSIEIIYRYQSGKKSFYTPVYMYIVDDTKVTLYADWGDYFLHLDSITLSLIHIWVEGLAEVAVNDVVQGLL